MAISQRKAESGRVAQFMAATACLSEISPFAWDTTGGPHPENSAIDATGGQLRVLAHLQYHSQSAQANPIIDALEVIRTTFGLTMEMLSDSCGVTRPLVYRWLAGDVTPKRQNQQRIFKLREAAMNWQREAYPYPKNHLHEPIMRAKTLLDLLNEDPVDVQRILFAGQRLKLAELDATAEVIPDPFE